MKTKADFGGSIHGFSFREPWQRLNPVQAGCTLREVRIELAPGHPMYGLDLIPIARSRQTDDALFLLDDGRVVQVHLTWSRRAELPPWPSHSIYATLEDWAQRTMIPVHGEDSDSFFL
jgi:hypothetical protein